VGYLYANFSLPRPLCSQLGPMYATDRLTDVISGGGILKALLNEVLSLDLKADRVAD